MGESLRVAQPAQALVALGAVEKSALRYVALGPEDVLPQLVRQAAGAFEEAGLTYGRVQSLPTEVRERGRLIQAAHLHITKAMIGEMPAGNTSPWGSPHSV